MKKLTWILGLLLLGMSLIMGRAAAVTEVPPVVEVAPANKAQTQVETLRGMVWYHQMRQAVPAVRKSVAKTEESQPLFSCTFESEADFTSKWTVTDGDGDGKTWRYVSGSEYPVFEGDDANYVKSTSIDDFDDELSTTETADKMATQSAVSMPEGKAYVTFQYILSEDNPVQLKVYYGKTADVAQMTLIGELNGKGDETAWSDKTMAFTVAEAGDYYFCFLHCTEDEWKMNGSPIYISKVEIYAGEVPGGDEPGGDDPVADAVAKPEFSIQSGEVALNTKVTISCATSGAEIYYTTDGSEPTDLNEAYGDGVVIDKAMTIKAIAYKDDAASEVAEASYTIKDDNPGGDDEEPGRDIFVCTFESADDFAAKWTVTDQDGDDKTWRYVTGMDTYYPAFDGSYDNGYVKSASRENEEDEDNMTETADYMMTKSAITMPAGKAYTAFKYALGAYNPVHLKVYCSKTPELEASGMTLIGELYDEKFVEDAWKDTAMVFTIAEAGDYYFWFLHCSTPDEWGMNLDGLYMDDIIIGTGRYTPTPDLQIEHVILPYSSCALGTAETIGVRLRNIGSAPITQMSLSYKINDEAAVTEEFTYLIAPGETKYVDFAQKADFSAEDKNYAITVSGTVEGETLTTNNEGTGRVTHFVPVETLPFVINTEDEAGQNQLGYDSEAWTYEEVEGFGNWFADTLVTRCIAMTGGNTYRFAFERQSGVDFGMIQSPESFWVVYGLAGTPMKDWQILKFYEADYTFGLYVHDEILVTPAIAGNYSFAIVSDERCCNASLFISRMEVDAVCEHDVVIADMMTSLARRTPALHAVAPIFDVMVVNRGLNDENVKVVLKHGDKEIGSSDLTLKKADTGYCKIQGKLGLIETGEVTLRLEAKLAATDATLENNKRDWTFTATDSLYAFDKDTNYGKAMTSKYVIGEIFTLTASDTLSSLIIGWFPLEESIAFGVEIYPVEEDLEIRDYYGTGECLFSQEFNRQAEGGLETVPMGVVLPEGRYFIGLKRLDPSLLHVGFDEQPEGKFYMLHQGILYPNVEYGYLALRAICGKAGVITGNGMEMALSQVKSYPNPVSGLWTVSADGTEINRVEIFNTMGSVVYRSADNLSAETWSVNMEGFMSGMYVARVYTNAGIQTLKVMVR